MVSAAPGAPSTDGHGDGHDDGSSTTASTAPCASPSTTPSTTSAASTRLLLVRHAVTAQTGPLLSGRTPGIDLSDAGREQAASLGQRLAAVPLAAVYASPMERTLQTALAVAAPHRLQVEVVDGLLEADYGEWTGGVLSELARTELWSAVQRAPSRVRFPRGEALTAMQARIVAALDALVAAHPGDTVVAVSHADPLKAAIAHYTGLHLDLFQRIVLSPASLSVLDVGPAGAALLTCNATADLGSLLAAPAAGADEGEGAAAGPQGSDPRRGAIGAPGPGTGTGEPLPSAPGGRDG